MTGPDECTTVISYLIYLNLMDLKNIAHVRFFEHVVFLYVRIWVFACLCNINLKPRNVIFDILDSNAFQNEHMLGLLSHLLLLQQDEHYSF